MTAERKETYSFDPNYGCCEWVSNGERCHYPGSISDSILGGGPYYCVVHSGNIDGRIGAEIVDQSRREIPNANYHIDARRAKSLADAKAKVPIALHGWTSDEYRDHAHKMIRKFITTSKT